MTLIKILAGVSLTAMLLAPCGVQAGSTRMTHPEIDKPVVEHGEGGKGGGTIEGDDTAPPEGPSGGHGPRRHGGGGTTAPRQPPTYEPTTSDFPAVDTVPTGSASCFYFDDWDLAGEGTLDGAYLTNTGDTVIKSGSVVYFTMGGQTIGMTVPFDIVPGGTWGYFVGNYSYQPAVFPAGTNLPPSGDCDIQIAFA